MEKEINVTVEAGIKELVIREGLAPSPNEPLKGLISAGPGTVSAVLEANDFVVNGNSICIVDRKNFVITFQQNITDAKGLIVNSKYSVPEYVRMLPINSEAKDYTSHEMAKLLKFHKRLFQSSEVYYALLKQLNTFNARISTELENIKEKTGSSRYLKHQVVNSNLPSDFRLIIEVYDVKIPLDVEIIVDTDTLNMKLVCVDLDDAVREVINELMDNEIEKIKALKKNLAIVFEY